MLAKQTLIQWLEGGNDALNVSFASSVDFPTWFGAGCFGGLACCMFAIAINALYTTLRRRGTTRQLAGAVVTCVISALLLLPAFVWYDQRVGTGFTASEGATLSFAEVGVVFVYVALWGWLLPLSATITYCLFALPRSRDESGSYSDSMRLPSLYQPTRSNNAGGAQQRASSSANAPNTPVPFVFSEGGGKLKTLQVWGWLEYRNGRLQGQRLALKQTVVKLGRGEDNDIWLDDEKASRDHAQLIWHLGTIYIIPCDIRNAVLLNGQPIHGPTIVRQGDVFEVGSQRFLFEYAERSNTAEHGDPLQRGVLERHLRRAPITPLPMNRNPSALTKPLKDDGDSYNPPDEYATIASQLPITNRSEPSQPWQETAELNPVARRGVSLPPPLRSDKRSSAFLIRSGEMAGKGFLLDRPVLTIGRGVESDVIINDASISRLHAQVLRQANGDYVQDLASRNGTKVNDEPLQAPRLLRQGDIVCLGEVRMEYTSASTALTTPLQPLPLPSRARSISGPVPLRLPSKPKKV
jgi:pSer/pThr/pTyr-binding forkhead associated (FHA) protein